MLSRFIRWLGPRSYRRPFLIRSAVIVLLSCLAVAFALPRKSPRNARASLVMEQALEPFSEFDDAYHYISQGKLGKQFQDLLEQLDVPEDTLAKVSAGTNEPVLEELLTKLPAEQKSLLLTFDQALEEDEAAAKQLANLANEPQPPEYARALHAAVLRQQMQYEAAFETFAASLERQSWQPAWEAAVELAKPRPEWLGRLRAVPGFPEAMEKFPIFEQITMAIAEGNAPKVIKLNAIASLQEFIDYPSMAVLALVAGGVWFLFLHNLAGIRTERWWVSALAVFAGFCSVFPTLLFITYQDYINQLTENGNPLNDLLYYVCGVGLREEISKLICFVPFIFWLRRRPIVELLVAAACVGLGFAISENIGYLGHDRGQAHSTIVGRFFTANFLHMAMTALMGYGLYHQLFLHPSRKLLTYQPLVYALLAILLHGLYDFLLGYEAHDVPGPWIAMVILVYTCNWLLERLGQFASGGLPRISSLYCYWVGIALVVGTALLIQAPLLGVFYASVDLLGAILASVIIGFLFSRRLT
jgi:protease PrsW